MYVCKELVTVGASTRAENRFPAARSATPDRAVGQPTTRRATGAGAAATGSARRDLATGRDALRPTGTDTVSKFLLDEFIIPLSILDLKF